jgi:hypothetical protein
MLEHSVEGHRVGWFPGSGLAFAEGHPGGDRLGCPDDLPEVLCALERALWDRDIPVEPRRSRSVWDGPCGPQKRQGGHRSTGFAGVRRLDVTCDLDFAAGAEGLAVLAGVAALNLPRMQTAVRRQAGGRFIETVAFHGSGGRKLLGRWYDKGVESGLAARGRLVRPEDQRRFTSDSRRATEELDTVYVRELFRQRFLPLWRAAKGVTVAGRMVLAAKVAELVEEGSLSAEQAEKLVGYLVLQQADCWSGARATRYRREALLRDNGLVLADGVMQEVEVDLHSVLEEALESDLWGSEG